MPDSADPLRVALIGYGRIASRFHAPTLASLPGCRLAAVVEADGVRRDVAVRAFPEASVVASTAELPDDTVGAVVICTPPKSHADEAVAAFAAGRHVFVEKPLAADLDDGRRIRDAWRSAGTVGRIGFNYRHHPLLRDAKRRIDAGVIGDLVAARSSFTAPARELPDWKRTRDGGGGVLLDFASHHVDLVTHLTGEPVVAVAATVDSLRDVGDRATLTATLAAGATLSSLFAVGTVGEQRWELFGTAGKLTIDGLDAAGVRVTPNTFDGYRARRIVAAVRGLDPRALLKTPGEEPSYRPTLAAFVAAAAAGDPAASDIGDGLRSLEVVLAAEESARTGRTVEIPAGDG